MSWLTTAINRLCALPALGKRLLQLPDQLAEVKLLTARMLIQQMKAREVAASIQEFEFKVFSQFGDDGIIQYLIYRVEIAPEQRIFIEFGVENYAESNTRFLLMNDNWRGLILDGDPDNMAQARASNYYWKHDLTAAAAFIDRDNVNSLFRNHGFTGEIGLLSIDIDGNDYWVWERIEAVNPVIVIVEYNSVLGTQHSVTIPYDPVFQRTRSHYSNLYWGCSLKALEELGRKKGYALVGSNSAGNNAYFVRRDRLGDIREMSAREAYVESKYRESRDKSGRLTYLAGKDRIKAIRNMLVFDVEQGKTIEIREIYEC